MNNETKRDYRMENLCNRVYREGLDAAVAAVMAGDSEDHTNLSMLEDMELYRAVMMGE